MNVFSLLSSEVVCSRLFRTVRWVVYTALSVVLEVLRVMEDIDVVLNATSVSLVRKLSMIKLGLS